MIRRFYEKYFKGDIIKSAKIRISRQTQLEVTNESYIKKPTESYIKLQEVVFMLCDSTAPSLELYKELKEN